MATFLVQVYAASRLAGDLLGTYSLLFSAGLLAAQVPASLIFAPSEVLAARQPSEARLLGFFATIRFGALFAVPAALLTATGAIPALATVDGRSLLTLVVGAIAFSVLTPIQDFIRSMLHVAGQSVRAAKVSLVYLVSILSVGSALHFVEPILVPFGALAAANLVSGTYGLLAVRAHGTGSRPRWSELKRLGSWLFAAGAANHGANFGSALVLERLLGLPALGVLEAVRVIARPAQVMALGLNAVIAPKILEAVSRADLIRVRRLRWGFWGGNALLGLPYLLLAGFSWAFNPMFHLLPLAFDFGGLAAASILAALMAAVPAPLVSESLAANRERELFAVAVLSGIALLLSSFWAASIGIFAGPVAIAIAALIRSALLLRMSH